MHRRQVVREAMTAVLTGATGAGANVFPSRARTLSDSEMPGIRVSTPQERIDGDLLNGQAPLHRIEIRVEVLAKAADDVDDVVDTVCEQVETAIAANPTLSGATAYCAFQSAEIEFEDEEQTVMQATLSFEAAFIQE